MKRLWKVVLVAVPIWAVLSTLAVGPVVAQSRYEPSLAGVSYREIAEWQGMYGGGAPFGPPCGPGYGNPVYMPNFCSPEPAGTQRLQKHAIRKGRK